MAASHAIVIGASSGGVSALLELAAAFPVGLDAVVGVVLHIGNQCSILPELLSRRAAWPAVQPEDGAELVPGTIFVAPPDRHMLFTADTVRLSRGPRENHARPAVDPLFRSAALEWRERLIGVVLTGHLDDGTAGLAAVKACGGTAIVQDPATAFEPSMPANALANVKVDGCLPLAEIAPALVRLVHSNRQAEPAPPAPHVAREHAIFEGKETLQNLSAAGAPSALTCPDCGGGLWELNEARPLRYRCRAGHAFSAGTLQEAQTDMAAHALWNSVPALQERAILLRRLANVAQATGDAAQAEVGRRRADRVHALAQMLSLLVR